MTYRICTICEVHHYENCNTCFGYGVVKSLHHIGKYIPISANEANVIRNLIPEYNVQWLHCPECNSTPYGIVEKVK